MFCTADIKSKINEILGFISNNNFIIVLLCIIFFLILWIGTFIYLYKNSKLSKRIGLFISDKLDVPVSYSQSMYLTLYYCGVLLAASIIFLLVFSSTITTIFGVIFSYYYIILLFLGIAASFTLSSFGTTIIYAILGDVNLPEEIRKIRWLEGIFVFPTKIAVLIVISSALIEEFFFRGVIFNILYDSMKLPFWFVLVFSTLVFTLEQVLLTDTKVQIMVILSSSLVISFIGSILYAVSGGVLLSMCMHASYVVFYVGMNKKADIT